MLFDVIIKQLPSSGCVTLFAATKWLMMELIDLDHSQSIKSNYSTVIILLNSDGDQSMTEILCSVTSDNN